MMVRHVLAILAAATTALPVSESFAADAMTREFRSMSACLQWIQSSAKKKRVVVVSDKPDSVTGYFGNGQFFGCKRRTTGTKGTFYEGYYMLE